MYPIRVLVALCLLPSCFSPAADEGPVDGGSNGSSSVEGSTGSEGVTTDDASDASESDASTSSSGVADEDADGEETVGTTGDDESDGESGSESTSTGEGPMEDPATCNAAKLQDPASEDGVYVIDPDGVEGLGEPFEVYCDMTTAGGGWTSLVHVTELDRLRFDLPHDEVAVSQGTSFWILEQRDEANYEHHAYLGHDATDYQAGADTPTDTGWTWNGIAFPNPADCHATQDLFLVSSEGDYPRSLGNPHFDPGHALPADVLAAASLTASTIDVALVANFPAVHIGCVGGNVLQDPIVWVR